MTWSVLATYGVGAFTRTFDSLIAARAWEIGMTSLGYDTTQPQQVGAGRHLRVIDGGRGESCVGSTAPAAEGA